MRRLPARSLVGVFQALFEFHVTVALDAVPSSSTNGNPVVRTAPLALFQCVVGTTPALSVAPIGVPVPTKSIPMAVAGCEDDVDAAL